MGMVIAAIFIYPTIMVFVANYEYTYALGEGFGEYNDWDYYGNFYRLCPMKTVSAFPNKWNPTVRCEAFGNEFPILLTEFVCTFILVTAVLNIKYINGVGQ